MSQIFLDTKNVLNKQINKQSFQKLRSTALAWQAAVGSKPTLPLP